MAYIRAKLSPSESEFFQKALPLKYKPIKWEPIFKLLAKQFRRSKSSIFKVDGPGMWADLGLDLTEPYKSRKARKRGSPYPILVWTGDMISSITDASHTHAVTEITPLKLVIGSTHPILPFHDSDRPRRKMPLRKVLFWGPEAPRFAKGKNLGLPRIAGDTIRFNIMRQLGATIDEIKVEGEVIERD